MSKRWMVVKVYEDLDFTLMEMNPFTLDKDGSPFPLDMRGELDDTAAFKSAKKWGPVEFPLPFGRSMTAAEEYVHGLDDNTGKIQHSSFIGIKQHTMLCWWLELQFVQ